MVHPRTATKSDRKVTQEGLSISGTSIAHVSSPLSVLSTDAANCDIVCEILESAKNDPRLKTPDELRDMALGRLGIQLLDCSSLPADGPLSAAQAANVFLNRNITVTTAIWDRITLIDPSFLEKLAHELLYGVINATDKEHYPDNRLELLYELLARDNNSADVRIGALTSWAFYATDRYKAEEMLLTAADISRQERGDREHVPFGGLIIVYKEQKRYQEALAICEERLSFLESHHDVPYATSVKGSLLKDKIECLSRLGKTKEAAALLTQARLMNDVSQQYRDIFNSARYAKEVIPDESVR